MSNQNHLISPAGFKDGRNTNRQFARKFTILTQEKLNEIPKGGREPWWRGVCSPGVIIAPLTLTRRHWLSLSGGWCMRTACSVHVAGIILPTLLRGKTSKCFLCVISLKVRLNLWRHTQCGPKSLFFLSCWIQGALYLGFTTSTFVGQYNYT